MSINKEAQIVMPEEKLNSHCRKDCKHYRKEAIFEVCAAEEALYLDNNAKKQQHTIRHMRIYECGPEGRLYRRKF